MSTDTRYSYYRTPSPTPSGVSSVSDRSYTSAVSDLDSNRSSTDLSHSKNPSYGRQARQVRLLPRAKVSEVSLKGGQWSTSSPESNYNTSAKTPSGDTTPSQSHSSFTGSYSNFSRKMSPSRSGNYSNGNSSSYSISSRAGSDHDSAYFSGTNSRRSFSHVSNPYSHIPHDIVNEYKSSGTVYGYDSSRYMSSITDISKFKAFQNPKRKPVPTNDNTAFTAFVSASELGAPDPASSDYRIHEPPQTPSQNSVASGKGRFGWMSKASTAASRYASHFSHKQPQRPSQSSVASGKGRFGWMSKASTAASQYASRASTAASRYTGRASTAASGHTSRAKLSEWTSRFKDGLDEWKQDAAIKNHSRWR